MFFALLLLPISRFKRDPRRLYAHMEQSHTFEKTLAVLLVLGWFVTPDLLANPRCCKLAAKYETRASRSSICVASFPGNPQERLFAGLISISDCSFLNSFEFLFYSKLCNFQNTFILCTDHAALTLADHGEAGGPSRVGNCEARRNERETGTGEQSPPPPALPLWFSNVSRMNSKKA